MAAAGFVMLSLPVLQDFLQERGISVTKLSKQNLVKLCEAVNDLDLPKNPDYKGISSCNDLSRKLNDLGLKDIDPLTMEGFSSRLSGLPNLSLYDVFNYLITSRADYDRKKLKAYKSCDDYRLFYDGHVENLEFNNLGDNSFCLFRAKVKPTQRDKTYLNKNHYNLWLSIGKKNGDVRSAYCTCIGGADGACRHIAAVLYEIEAYEEQSCTDGENKWLKRPRHHDCPVPVKRLKIVKAKYHAVTVDLGNNNVGEFDPRAVVEEMNDEKIATFHATLKEIDPNTQVLDVLQTDFSDIDIHVKSSEDEQCFRTISLSGKCKKYIEDNNLCYHNADQVPDSVCDIFVANMHATDNDIQYVESHTVGQSLNANWHAIRKGMITASNFKKVCDCVTHNRNPPSLIKTLLGEYGDIKSASLAWGSRKEKSARSLYQRVARTKHIQGCIDLCGLRIFQEKPFIGCSVDGLLKCKCKFHGPKIVEIKCPYSDRDKHPKEVGLSKGCLEVTDGHTQLSKDSEYFHQIQGQMGIYGYNFADLVIYTKKGIHVVEDIPFDQQFFDDMIGKVESYFKNILLKNMLII